MSADPQMDEIRKLIDRVAQAIDSDIEWEDPADKERSRQRAKRAILELSRTHAIISLKPARAA